MPCPFHNEKTPSCKINDDYGHNAGDVLLMEISERLKKSVRDSDTIARWGGDEFTIILPKIRDFNDIRRLCKRILNKDLNNIVVDNQELRITASIGIAIYPQDGEDVETLVKNADAAMYKSKDLGKNQFHMYKPDMNSKIMERLNFESGLYIKPTFGANKTPSSSRS